MRVLLDVLLAAAIAAVTLLGVWTSSSLAAYLNGPLWLAGLAGLLLFPVLPLAWEAWSARRRARRRVDDARPRMFGFGERVILRTLVLNLAFLGALLVRFPHSALAALSTRGDWFLDGRAGPGAERARGDVFTLASGLEWIYQALRDDPYRDQLPDPPQTETTPEPAPVATTVPPAPREQGPAPAAPAEAPRPLFAADGTPLWPWPNVLHPLVAALPPEAETSVASVARHLTAGEPNPWLRVKALHDYVADRVAYDVEAYRTRRIPPQDAETVFRTRRSVCAGYANLLAALGAAAGIEIVVVGGDARLEGSDVTGEAHAWNAAKVNGRWALLDPTWNSGYVRDDRFVKQYETEYLFAPPEVQGVSHFPDDAVWQLRTPPLSRGEFFRQPMMRARFYAHGLRLRSPERSQVTVEGRLQVVLENPQQQFLLGRFVPREGGTGGDCRVENGPEARLDCDFPREGTYRVEMFVSPQQYGTYHEVGELEVVSRGAS